MTQKTRHILGLSGGKDSAALAILMRDRVPEMEYIFTDTEKELPETYEYIAKLEAFLGKPVVRLNAERGFDHWLELHGGYLPSPRVRWCTRQLKLKPFEDYVGDSPVISYVGIRADEDREGYVSTKPNIKAVFPFKEQGITKADVFRILEESGVGIPEYYQWRTRSGCYFCFYQRKSEWAGLLERHPDLFEKAKAYEKFNPETGERYTWQQNESLDELARPERLAQIRKKAASTTPRDATLANLFATDEDDADERACLVCDL
jgi:3'-phosphoadenosine 5'-phosphosulfate sulfotransferase (PAPS reductase)/FAD synthetase